VPILSALCVETLLGQFHSSLLSFLFIWSVKDAIPDDEDRAQFNGKVSAFVSAYILVSSMSRVNAVGLLSLLS
jgi:hypothetical protein